MSAECGCNLVEVRERTVARVPLVAGKWNAAFLHPPTTIWIVLSTSMS